MAICFTHDNLPPQRERRKSFAKYRSNQRTLSSKGGFSLLGLDTLGKTAYFGILTRGNHELDGGGGVLSERRKAIMTQERTPQREEKRERRSKKGSASADSAKSLGSRSLAVQCSTNSLHTPYLFSCLSPKKLCSFGRSEKKQLSAKKAEVVRGRLSLEGSDISKHFILYVKWE